MQWTRLSFLENLVSLSSEGLQSTTRISICTLKKGQHMNPNIDPELTNTLALPNNSASDALNMLLRMLITKIPCNNLRSFW